jgi:hypothetical protein
LPRRPTLKDIPRVEEEVEEIGGGEEEIIINL